MDWQYPLTLAVIGIAAVAVTWRFFNVVRSAWSGTDCGSGCGKCRPTSTALENEGRVGLPLIRND